MNRAVEEGKFTVTDPDSFLSEPDVVIHLVNMLEDCRNIIFLVLTHVSST